MPTMTPVELCPCAETHHPGAHYYVSVIADPGNPRSKWRPVAGPFGTHAEALAWVRPVNGLVCARYNPHGKADWYGYGTVAMAPGYTTPGLLNAELGIAIPAKEG